MASQLHPYINFKDTAAAAMDFYKSVFGGTLEQTTFEQFGMADNPDDAGKIMHSMLVADNGITFMAADTPASMEFNQGAQVKLSLSGDDHDELTGYFTALSAGGMVTLPLDKAPWGDYFGMLVDKFGIQWMVNVVAPKPDAPTESAA